MYKRKYSCYEETSQCYSMTGLFIGFLVEKCVAFGWHRFRFSPCLMRKRVQKSQAILALLDSFQACIKNECDGFIRGSKHRGKDESARPAGVVFGIRRYYG